jgi:hypothetical protein
MTANDRADCESIGFDAQETSFSFGWSPVRAARRTRDRGVEVERVELAALQVRPRAWVTPRNLTACVCVNRKPFHQTAATAWYREAGLIRPLPELAACRQTDGALKGSSLALLHLPASSYSPHRNQHYKLPMMRSLLRRNNSGAAQFDRSNCSVG